MYGYESGSDSFTTVFNILITVFFVILVGAIGYGLFVWIRNNNSPRETVSARVVTKRIKVSGSGHSLGGHTTTVHSSTFTRYFVTFELENGKRLEFHVKGAESGMLAEGDTGTLTYQGSRYLGFDRAFPTEK